MRYKTPRGVWWANYDTRVLLPTRDSLDGIDKAGPNWQTVHAPDDGEEYCTRELCTVYAESGWTPCGAEGLNAFD